MWIVTIHMKNQALLLHIKMQQNLTLSSAAKCGIVVCCKIWHCRLLQNLALSSVAKFGIVVCCKMWYCCRCTICHFRLLQNLALSSAAKFGIVVCLKIWHCRLLQNSVLSSAGKFGIVACCKIKCYEHWMHDYARMLAEHCNLTRKITQYQWIDDKPWPYDHSVI